MSISSFIKDITQSLTGVFRKHPYTNLVFKGGGVRGIAYMGALEELEAMDMLSHIERVAGTSSGAIAATLMAFRKEIPQTIEMFNTLDLQKVPQRKANGSARNIILLKNSENYTRLFEKYGWYSSLYFHNWLSAIIAEQCRGNARATFRDFRRLGYRDLHIVASNLSRHRAEDFSFDSTPDVAVADAVRMSMSIPLFFESLRFDGKRFGNGDFYVDGGVFNNYPIRVFDQPQYRKNSRYYRDGVNWETLGLFLFPGKLKNKDIVEEPGNLWEFLDLMVRSLNDSHQVADLVQNVPDKKRTIQIDDCGISSTSFDIAPDSEEYKCLYASGKKAVQEFFRTD